MALTGRIHWIEGVIVAFGTLLANVCTSVAADIPPLPAKAFVAPDLRCKPGRSPLRPTFGCHRSTDRQRLKAARRTSM